MAKKEPEVVETPQGLVVVSAIRVNNVHYPIGSPADHFTAADLIGIEHCVGAQAPVVSVEEDADPAA